MADACVGLVFGRIAGVGVIRRAENASEARTILVGVRMVNEAAIENVGKYSKYSINCWRTWFAESMDWLGSLGIGEIA